MDTATEEFDNHDVWGTLENFDIWLAEAEEKIDPEYEGLPNLADSLLRRLQIVAEVTRMYLDAAVKEAVPNTVLDEIKKHHCGLYTDLQSIDGGTATDVDEELASANMKAEALLAALPQLSSDPGSVVKAAKEADAKQQQRTGDYLLKAQRMLSDVGQEHENLKEQISQAKTASKKDLADLRESIEDVAGQFVEEINEGVEAGKKRIDDQIATLRESYTKLIDSEKERAETEIRDILRDMTSEKKKLDAMVADTQRVAGYIAENEMSRKFEEQARSSFRIWIGFIIAAVIAAIVTFLTLSSAGEAALVDDATGSGIVEAVIKALTGAGTGAIAAYLFRQASLQQRSYQDSRNAAMRLGSLDAFLERFDSDDAQAIREGVGQRVYIDGELGEIAPDKQGDRTARARRTRETATEEPNSELLPENTKQTDE
ncbi:hypothetical protein AKJ24_10075 [Corynebacterium glutamicum]|nr:hypothetical protein AKJ24_10075 [Corynebacterium glutamicum]